MTVRLSLVSTERALPRPAQNARQGWSSRAACVVTLTGDDGNTGFGEACPLPGFSPDTLGECQNALLGFDPSALAPRLEPGQSLLHELASATRGLAPGVPAARAALECAVLDLWSRAAGKPAWVLIGAPNQGPPSARHVAALLQGEPEQACEQAQAAHARGARCFKLKIGRTGQLERELYAVRQLRAELGPQVQLRLDANQSFSAQQAHSALARFAEHGIELVEEPCPPGELLRASGVPFPLPLALDESLSALSPSALIRAAGAFSVHALVLKPTLLGGVSACAAWADAAHHLGAQVILSHAFDGPLGLMLSAALALNMGSETLAHGLDMHGARLEGCVLPGFSGAELNAWSESGFGSVESGA